MSDENSEPAETAQEPEKKKGPLKALLFTASSALIAAGAAGGTAYVVSPGMKSCEAAGAASSSSDLAHAAPKDVAFVNMEPLIISLGPNAQSRYLKISISLETTKTHEKRLNELSPRIRDVLNGYLRAVDEEDLMRPSGMTRLRAQMLRRLQLIAPSEGVSNVLITDFVLT